MSGSYPWSREMNNISSYRGLDAVFFVPSLPVEMGFRSAQGAGLKAHGKDNRPHQFEHLFSLRPVP